MFRLNFKTSYFYNVNHIIVMKSLFFIFGTKVLTVQNDCSKIYLHLGNKCAKRGDCMLSDRQKLILKAIIEEYVDTMEPVGSKVLTEKPYLKFSSATIRYDMQNLEENGYLEKTHTSSGRVPSEQGYKYYVEKLLTRDEDIVALYPIIDELFDNKYFTREDASKRAVELFSKMTGYMTIMLGSSENYSKVKKMEIVPLSEKEAVLMIVTNAGAVQSQKITIPHGFKMEDLLRLIDMFDNAIYDHSVYEINEILSKEAMKPRIRKMVDFRDDVLSFLIKGFSRFQTGEFYQSGLTNIFNQPEFHNHESMNNILRLIDDESMIDLMKDCGSGLTVKIGSDNLDKNMKNCSIISIPYYIDDNAFGTIACIGPMRMQYKKVIPLLEYIATSMRKLYDR